jgi:hypothetical protein
MFAAEVVTRRLIYVARDSFRGTALPAKLAEITTPVLVRTDLRADEVEAFVTLGDGAVALIDSGYNHVELEVAAATADAARRGIHTLRRALESKPPVPTQVSVAFWMRGETGGDVRHRQIDAPAFETIADN